MGVWIDLLIPAFHIWFDEMDGRRAHLWPPMDVERARPTRIQLWDRDHTNSQNSYSTTCLTKDATREIPGGLVSRVSHQLR